MLCSKLKDDKKRAILGPKHFINHSVYFIQKMKPTVEFDNTLLMNFFRQIKMKLLAEEDSFIKLTDLCKLGNRLCKMKFKMQKIIDPNYEPPQDVSNCDGL